MKKPTDDQIEAFKNDLKHLIKEHNLSIRSYYIQYDEYDSDSGYYIVRGEDGIQDYDIDGMYFKK